MFDIIRDTYKIWKNIFKGIKFLIIGIIKSTGAITGLFKKKSPTK